MGKILNFFGLGYRKKKIPSLTFDKHMKAIRDVGDGNTAEELEVLHQEILEELDMLRPKTEEEFRAIVEPRRKKMLKITERRIKELEAQDNGNGEQNG